MLPTFITTGEAAELNMMLAFLLHECPATMIPTMTKCAGGQTSWMHVVQNSRRMQKHVAIGQTT